jgi:diadenosine tetraphosphatase ApaH/serine/threonine PP2A family protein phosphatase
VLGALPEVGSVMVLGDIVGYGPNPNEVIERLRLLQLKAVRGNHDHAVEDPSILDWFNEDAAAALRWTAGALSASNRAFLAALPPIGRLGRNRYVHGSPRKPYLFEYILEELQALRILQEMGRRLCFFGHTHLPRIFSEDEGEFVPPPGRTSPWIELPASALVNPGSVGQPRDGNPEAAFAIVDLSRPAVQFHRVPYDVATTQEKILDAGLPPIEAARLAYGR